MSYDRNSVIAASDHCVKELINAIDSGKEREFDLEQILQDWAMTNGISEDDVGKFVKEARELFGVEVVVRGLQERSQEGSADTRLSEDARRSRRMLFSPVYRLYHESRPLNSSDEEE